MIEVFSKVEISLRIQVYLLENNVVDILVLLLFFIKCEVEMIRSKSNVDISLILFKNIT